MPKYVYKAASDGCEYCKHSFEVKQSIGDKPIERCPKCGVPVRRAPTIYAFQIK